MVSKFDGWSVAGLMTYTQVLLLVILAALAGLLYYFLYLLTGWRSMWRTITFAYAAYYVAILFFLQWADPVGIKQGAISDSLEYGREVTGHWFATVLGALLLAPVFIGALGYFSLYFKAPDRSGRFRIGALAGAFVFWFGTSLLASYVFHWNDHTWWRWASSLVSLIASYMVYISYRPPAWMRKRFRLHGYDDAEPA